MEDILAKFGFKDDEDCAKFNGEWIDEGAFPEASTPLVGDINSDGIVNILDVVGLINIILGMAEENSAGDLNSDGLINILDVVLLVNNILS